ncbi:hypothetical protein KFE25_002610 [Diacronema lutheri]|uniref:Uncharacterized protein n=1 Tax=Diacronema lutheri TaxID=2081491 RepID=A0A8J5XE94_DIALT|nr:hypothetical protein KFE25_002610 [Diacronema lutheri]
MAPATPRARVSLNAAAGPLERLDSGAIVRPPPSVDTIRERLDAARAAGRDFRARVHLPMRWAGSTLAAGGVVLGAALPDPVFGALLALPGLAVLLLALLPTDARPIRRTAGATAAVALATSALTAAAVGRVGARCALGVGSAPAASCTDAAPSLALATLGACAGACAGARVCVALARWTPRALLDALFRTAGALCAALSGVLLVTAALRAARARPPRTAAAAAAAAAAPGACAVEAFAVAVLLRSPRARARVQSWLAARGEAAHTAAGIAALFDDAPVREVQERAAASFRAVALDALGPADLLPSADAAKLHARSSAAGFGGVDAFVSHSWHDPPAQKWAALRKWGDDFALAHGREPRIWLDRACVPQESIGEAIRCLPLYLAGCSTLLLLRGPTTLRRLWCVVELHIFLEMGGDMDRIQQVRLSAADGDGGVGADAAAGDETARAAMAAASALGEVGAFDVEAATCSKAADRERLLTVIEAGAGGIAGFNGRLREALLRLDARAAAQQRASHASPLAQWAAAARRSSGDRRFSDDGGGGAGRASGSAGASTPERPRASSLAGAAAAIGAASATGACVGRSTPSSRRSPRPSPRRDSFGVAGGAHALGRPASRKLGALRAPAAKVAPADDADGDDGADSAGSPPSTATGACPPLGRHASHDSARSIRSIGSIGSIGSDGSAGSARKMTIVVMPASARARLDFGARGDLQPAPRARSPLAPLAPVCP